MHRDREASDVNPNSLPGTCLHWNEVREGRSLYMLLSRKKT